MVSSWATSYLQQLAVAWITIIDFLITRFVKEGLRYRSHAQKILWRRPEETNHAGYMG